MQRHHLVPSDLNDQIFGRSVDELTAALIAQTKYYLNEVNPDHKNLSNLRLAWCTLLNRTETKREQAKTVGLSFSGLKNNEVLARIYPRTTCVQELFPHKKSRYHIPSELLSLYRKAICKFLKVPDESYALGFAVCLYLGASKAEINKFVADYIARTASTAAAAQNIAIAINAGTMGVEILANKLLYAQMRPHELETIEDKSDEMKPNPVSARYF